MEINIKITHDMEILPLIKYWLPYIKVISPSSLDQAVKSDLEGCLKKFY